MKGQVDVRKPEGQPDQSNNQQSDGEQDQSWLQQEHRISDEPKQVSSSLNRPALGAVQVIRERERVEEKSGIDQREDRHSDDDQGDLEKNRVDLTGSKARVEKEQQERENRDARSDERHNTADVKIGGLIPHRGLTLPLHRYASSINKTVMNAFTSRPGLHPAEEGERTTSVAIAATIRPVLPLGLRRRPATPSGARGPSREVRSGLPQPHRPLRGPRGRIPNGRSRETAAPYPTARTGSRACNKASAVVSPSTRPTRRAAGLRRGGSARRDLLS